MEFTTAGTNLIFFFFVVYRKTEDEKEKFWKRKMAIAYNHANPTTDALVRSTAPSAKSSRFHLLMHNKNISKYWIGAFH